MKKQRKLILKYIKENKINQALGEAISTIEYYDPDYKIHFYAGYCYYMDKNHPSAVEHYKKALSLSSTPEESFEVYKGLSKIYIEYEYLYIEEEKKKEIEEVLLFTLCNVKDKMYTAHEKKTVVFLLNLYLYNDIDKYTDAFIKYCMQEICTSGEICMNEDFKDDGFFMLKEYFNERLKHFNRDLKSIVDSGCFSKERKDIIKELQSILAKADDLYLYYPELVRVLGNEFVESVCDGYLLYLTMHAYSNLAKVPAVVSLVSYILAKGIKIKDDSVILMILSDFLDIPTILGVSATYKKIYYNTLSPTILLLRFPNNQETMQCVLEVYKEMQESLDIEYNLKIEYVSTLLIDHTVQNDVLTDREYSLSSAVSAVYPEIKMAISCATNILILLGSALEAMNVTVINEVLQNSSSNLPVDSILEAFLKIEKISPSITGALNKETKQNPEGIADKISQLSLTGMSIDCEGIKENLLLIGVMAYKILFYREFLFEYVIERINANYHVNIVKKHMKLLSGNIEEVYEYLVQHEDQLHEYRAYLGQTGTNIGKFEMIYSYHKFACEYINKALSGSTGIEVPGDYISIYSKQHMGQAAIPNGSSVCLYKYPVDENISHFKHLMAVNNYEKGNKTMSLMLLKELHTARPHDYYILCDLGAILAESNETLHLVDTYLRIAQNISSPHLFLLSMQYHKKQKIWEMVERRAKEVLMFGYDYIIKMTLVEALSEEKKYKYAIKTASEIEEVEKKSPSSSVLVSVQIFMVYLYIKIDELVRAEEIIDMLLEKELKEAEKTKVLQYKKHLYALRIQTAIKKEEPEDVLGLTKAYQLLSSTEQCSDEPTEIDRTTAISDAYATLLEKVLTKDPSPCAEPKLYLDTDDQQELITVSKLLLTYASVSNQLENPAIHSVILNCIKKANLQGETRDALEVELLLRIVRDEDVQHYYEEDKKSEETPFARVILSLLYYPADLAATTREYLKNTTLADMDVILMLAHIVAEQKNPRNTADLEAMFLHLCRKYTPDSSEVRWLYELLKN
ncbi:hypothetical protein NEPAR05_0431 [Nematocida parisii]|nr:hypothetical protein NEPAR05_0431 [Nematocida parisii]